LGIPDSKEPDWSKFRAFLMGEVRYASLEKLFPAQAQELFETTQRNAAWRYEQYRRLAGR
jgi:pyruvate-ferredoxin/flavodoxin oxidoreductase